MKRLTHYDLFENKAGNEWQAAQNSFADISPGGISLFKDDVVPSTGRMDSIEGYNFTMCTTLVGLWTLEGCECHLIGLRSPFGRTDYVEYLSTLAPQAVNLLRERMEYYSMPEDAALLFGIDGTTRVLQGKFADSENPLYTIVYPDGDIEVSTNFNNTLRGKTLVQKIEAQIGKRIYNWLKLQFNRHTA